MNDVSSPYFSIVIPVYNVATYLRESLESVLAQTYNGWEALCVDDGSTDDSGAILDEYATRDNRFRVIHKENGGVSSARNLALDQLKGLWVCFLDGDDVLHPRLLETCFRIMARCRDVDMIQFGQVTFVDGDRISWGSADELFRRVDGREFVHADMFRGSFCGRVYCRAKMGDVRFMDLVLGEDEIFKNQCVERLSTFAITKKNLYAYRQRQGSACNSAWTRRKLADEFAWRLEWFRLWTQSRKQLDRCQWRGCAQWLTERFSALYFEQPNAVTEGLWHVWRESLREISGCSKFPMWNRFVLRLFNWLPFRVTAFALFYIPNWLKVRGLHR